MFEVLHHAHALLTKRLPQSGASHSAKLAVMQSNPALAVSTSRTGLGFDEVEIQPRRFR